MDQLSLAYVLSFGPTEIRVTYGELKANATVGRITVIVKDDSKGILIIEHIWQERKVPIPEGCRHFADLRHKLQEQKNV